MYLDTVKRFSIKLQHPEGKELTPEGSVNSFKTVICEKKIVVLWTENYDCAWKKNSRSQTIFIYGTVRTECFS